MERVSNYDEIDYDIDALYALLYKTYGYDFRNYAKASQKRRLLHFLQSNKISRVAEIMERVTKERGLLFELLNGLTVSTTELFRDPDFYTALQRNVIPLLKTYPSFKIWHAGCSTGEEAFSLAILLHEEGLLDRAVIYATDINRKALDQAREGIVSSQVLKRDSQNYYKAGLSKTLHQYWYTNHGYAMLDKKIQEKILFAEHNLVTDYIFGEMQLVLCRNVLIYFNRNLQNDVLVLLNNSLCRKGFLCLGTKETLLFSSVVKNFDILDRKNRIFQKKYI